MTSLTEKVLNALEGAPDHRLSYEALQEAIFGPIQWELDGVTERKRQSPESRQNYNCLRRTVFNLAARGEVGKGKIEVTVPDFFTLVEEKTQMAIPSEDGMTIERYLVRTTTRVPYPNKKRKVGHVWLVDRT